VWKKLWVRDDGATMMEYALLVALVAVVVIAAVTLIGTNTSTKLSEQDLQSALGAS
jgi:Flp pilus assembly pilin Flp